MKSTGRDGRQSHRTKRNRFSDLPLAYSCSGCSSVAQLSNGMAIRLDRENLAERRAKTIS
ncbi:MAG: hypothetical protein KDK37_17545 [Leptospiraceae bacterium]|nr:hypothetical protein [Leptospiraceae bacterium]MCB1306098.1 hypothetical protein [Leptospiraceae bacterium]